jgi:hypothetical protein
MGRILRLRGSGMDFIDAMKQETSYTLVPFNRSLLRCALLKFRSLGEDRDNMSMEERADNVNDLKIVELKEKLSSHD